LSRLPCEKNIYKADNDGDSEQKNGGCHGDGNSSDQLNTNRNSNVFCYQPLSSYQDTDDDKTTSEQFYLQCDQLLDVTINSNNIHLQMNYKCDCFAGTDQNVTITDQNVTIIDQNVTITDQNVTLTDQNITLTDQNVTITNKNVTITDQNVTITNQNVTTDQNVTIIDQNVTITNQNVTITESH